MVLSNVLILLVKIILFQLILSPNRTSCATMTIVNTHVESAHIMHIWKLSKGCVLYTGADW